MGSPAACGRCGDVGFIAWTEEPQWPSVSVTLKMEQCASWRGDASELEARMRHCAAIFDAECRLLHERRVEAMTNDFLYGNPYGPEHRPTPSGLFRPNDIGSTPVY